MTYKKYISKNGKRIGPYIYTTKRIDGKTVTQYLGKGKDGGATFDNRSKILVYSVLGIFILILASFFLLNPIFTGKSNSNISGLLSGHVFEGDIDTLNQTSNQTINESLANESIISENETLNSEQDIVPETDESAGNVAEIGENLKDKQTLNQNLLTETVNETVKIKISRSTIKLGERVKWTQNITIPSSENITIELPKDAENIVVTKIDKKDKENVSVEIIEDSKTNSKKLSLTGAVTFGEGYGEVVNLVRLFEGLFMAITGGATDSKEINLNDSAAEYVVEYYTEAPTAQEKDTSYGKEVVISAPSELNYTDVLSFTNISEMFSVGEESKIKIFWKEDNSYVAFDAYDTDGNDKLDYVEWITPHLSNQTFWIIFITKAEHLDENRVFVEDVYDYVKERDNNFTLIPSGDYLRVTFEVNLTKERDITIYAKASTPASIEVYEKDKNETIAVFENISEDKEYKIYLANLAENYSQDVFDLKMVGDVEVDWVVDPVSSSNFINFTDPTPINGVTINVNSIKINTITNETDTDFKNYTYYLYNSTGLVTTNKYPQGEGVYR